MAVACCHAGLRGGCCRRTPSEKQYARQQRSTRSHDCDDKYSTNSFRSAQQWTSPQPLRRDFRSGRSLCRQHSVHADTSRLQLLDTREHWRFIHTNLPHRSRRAGHTYEHTPHSTQACTFRRRARARLPSSKQSLRDRTLSLEGQWSVHQPQRMHGLGEWRGNVLMFNTASVDAHTTAPDARFTGPIGPP